LVREKTGGVLPAGFISGLKKLKSKGFPYSLPSIGLGADPGVQAVSPQITVSHPPGGRLPPQRHWHCHYFPPGLRLPSQPQSITAPWPVTSYTAWWQRHIGMNNLSEVAMQLLSRVGFEPTNMSECIRGNYDDDLYKSTYTLVYFTL